MVVPVGFVWKERYLKSYKGCIPVQWIFWNSLKGLYVHGTPVSLLFFIYKWLQLIDRYIHFSDNTYFCCIKTNGLAITSHHMA